MAALRAPKNKQLMDPIALSNAEWTEIGKLLTSLWMVVALIIVFATNMLVGLVFIPSLVASQHLPSSLQKTRVLFYAGAIVSFALAIVFLLAVIDRADIIDTLFEDYWI